MYSTTPAAGQPPGATKTAMLTMGGVRVQSPYKLLMGCTGAKSTYQGSVHAYSSQVGRELENHATPR